MLWITLFCSQVLGIFSMQHQSLPSISSSANASTCEQEPSIIFPPKGRVRRVCWTLPFPSRMKRGLREMEEEGGGIICRHVRSVSSEFLGATLQRIWVFPLVVCLQGNKSCYPVFTLCVSQIPPGSCFLVTVKWGCFGAVSKWNSYFHGGFLMEHTQWYYFLPI